MVPLLLRTRLFGRARCPSTHLYRRICCRTEGIGTDFYKRARCLPTRLFHQARCQARGNRLPLSHRARCRVRRIGTLPPTMLRSSPGSSTSNLFGRRLDTASDWYLVVPRGICGATDWMTGGLQLRKWEWGWNIRHGIRRRHCLLYQNSPWHCPCC